MNQPRSNLSPTSHVLALVWLVLWCGVLAAALIRPPAFNTQLMALLPSDHQNPAIERATEQTAKRYANNLIWVLSPATEHTTAEVTAFWQSLEAQLTATGLVDQIRYAPDVDLAKAQAAEQQYRYARISRDALAPLMTQEWETLQERALQRLFGWMPTGGFDPIQDPFLLSSTTPPTLTHLQIHNGLLSVNAEGARHYVMQTRLSGSAFDAATQATLMRLITEAKAQADQVGGALRVSGLLLHTAAGTEQAKSEISSIGVGSLVGILILSVWAFRSIRPFLLSLVPTAAGTVFGIGVTALILGEIHLVTLAFAAGLIGVSIDYALHFLTDRHQHTPAHTRARLLPGLLLGLITSVLAYSTLGVAPFPGLKQMALLCVFGLIGAWLTVVLWYPYLTQWGRWQPLNSPAALLRAVGRMPRLSVKTMGLISIAMMIVTAITLAMHPAKDDLRALQTSPASLIENDQTIARWLGLSSEAQFLLVEAPDIETLLQREESVVPMLDKAQREGALTGYQSLSQSLPSQSHQAALKIATAALYVQALPKLALALKLTDQQQSEAMAALNEAPYLTLDIWKTLPSSEAFRPLLIETELGFISLIKLQATTPLTQQAVAPHLPEGVVWVDRVDRISQLLSHYRTEFSLGLLVGAILITCVLVGRYRTASPQVLIPVVLSVCTTLTLLSWWLGHINLFHLMALVLVLGIGLDMGILLTETQQNAYTWLAVTLSVMTSVLAFGLLAFSATPMLAAFGQTVLLGLLAVWCFGLLLRRHD